jgi:pre-rRNA-processing protein TSR1
MFRAYLCPNPGSSTNLGSRKQRLIFIEVDRNDEQAVLEAGKIADIVVVVMSCKETEVSGLKVDPDKYSNAIDEVGYKALGHLRSQGMPALIGVLQHLELLSSKKQPQIKRLFLRYFTSEFTDRHKFMNVNLSQAQTDVNALLRQVAVLYPEDITWRQNRSYMLGNMTKVNEEKRELEFEGYIRGNILNVKRLIHITGVHPQAFKVRRIEIAKDPCPVKVSQKEKEKVMATSKAQSIISSRKSSRRGSMDVSRSMIPGETINKCIQNVE